MSQILEQDLDSLDLYMEVLRIVHHHPASTAATVFSHATLAMDAASCQGALDSLLHQGLVQLHADEYSISASGVQTLIPVKRDGKFPASMTQSYVAALPPAPSAPTLQIAMKNGACSITKNNVTLDFSASEMQQIWKKLQRESDHHA